MKTSKFIIKVLYGGLGDHLFYSHLPRVAKETCGFREVLISNLSEFRHADYKRIIWEMNPYVDGFCDEDAPYPDFSDVPRGLNILDHIMRLRGLDDGRRGHEPELFLKPPRRADLSDFVVYDPNFVSNVGEVSSEHVARYFRRSGTRVDGVMAFRGRGYPIEGVARVLTTQSLEDYCSIIVSAKRFVCMTSGGATLAAALGVGVTALWGRGQLPMFHHSSLHRYVNVNPEPATEICVRKARSMARAVKRAAKRLVGAG